MLNKLGEATVEELKPESKKDLVNVGIRLRPAQGHVEALHPVQDCDL